MIDFIHFIMICRTGIFKLENVTYRDGSFAIGHKVAIGSILITTSALPQPSVSSVDPKGYLF